MDNKFLNNVYEGKNNWWRYLITILLIYVVFYIVMYFVSLVIPIFTIGVKSTNAIDIIIFYMNILFSYVIMLIFLFIALKFIHKRDFISLANVSEKYDEFTGKARRWINRIRWIQIIKGAFAWSIYMAIMHIINYVQDPTQFVINISINDLYLLIFLIILTIPIQVTYEELFFRGYINQGLSLKIKSPIIIIIISSIIFAISHIIYGGVDPVTMITYSLSNFIVGAFFSIATLADNGIELALGAHFANNVYSVFTSSIGGTANGSAGAAVISINELIINTTIETASLLIFGLIIFIFMRKKIMKALSSN
jgi:membrane protease YdiL (CAAX protease family)